MDFRRELRDEGTELLRLKSLSDGVFAIVLTFLIFRLDIAKFVSAESDGVLWFNIREQSTALLGYTLSFFIIASFWMLHQRVFRHFRKFNGTLLWQNITFLFFVSILPLTTSIHSGNPKLATAWVIYATNNAVAGLSMLGIWLKCSRADMVCDKTSKNVKNFFVWRIGAIPIVFLASIPLAYRNITLATWSPVLIPILLGAIHLAFGSKLRHLKLVTSWKKPSEAQAEAA
ncbi:MAG: TMEM175 family protein [Armatimonadota bacterium]